MEFTKCWDVRWKGPEKRNKPDVAASTAKHPDSRSQISRYGWMQPACMRSVSFLGKFTSGSRIRASRSDLLKLPNEALFGIVFAINHIPVLSISLPRIIFKRVSLFKKCHCGSRCPFNSLVMSHIRELHTRGILKTAKWVLKFFTSEDKTKPNTTEFPFFYYNG